MINYPFNYILDENGNPQICKNIIEWAIWMEGSNCVLATTKLHGIVVSTVFLGYDHSFVQGPPILFQTMVFAGSLRDVYCDRYATKKEALEGHKKAVKWVKRRWGIFVIKVLWNRWFGEV